MHRTYLVLLFVAGMALPAMAQKSSDPNLGHFYMGRQEWTIEDTGPVVNDKRGSSAPGGFSGSNAPALPKSGWQPYSSTIPSVHNALPKVETGVPKPVPQPKGAKGKAGNLTAKPAAAAKPHSAIKTYTPYATAPATAPTAGSSSYGSSTSVHGSLLQKLHSKGKSY